MQFINLGYFSKTKGIKGELILKTDELFEIEEVKALFTESSGSMAPHFIEKIEENNTGIVVKFDSINSVEAAKFFVGKKVFIEEKFIVEEKEEHDWIGYELIDNKHGSLGKILSVDDNGAQLLVQLNYKEKDIVLPLVEELIGELNTETKVIHYTSPEGLIEMYLEE